MANEIPVYMITGFLEGGKTSFLKFTLQQDYFNDGSKTLLILCEEGETELDQEFMDKYHVVTETIEEESELNREYFREVGKRHKPDRVIIEYNGMWLVSKFEEMELPEGWVRVWGEVNAAGVEINKIEILKEHPCFAEYAA